MARVATSRHEQTVNVPPAGEPGVGAVHLVAGSSRRWARVASPRVAGLACGWGHVEEWVDRGVELVQPGAATGYRDNPLGA